MNKTVSTINPDVLMESIFKDSYDLFVKKIFEHSSLIHQKNSKGETLLHISCFFGMIDKYYALINVGLEPSITAEGNNLLHYASFSGKDNFLIVELVKSGISPIERNNQGQSALHLCANEQITHYLNLWAIRNKIDVLSLLDNDNNNVAHGCQIAQHSAAALYWIKNYPQLKDQLNYAGKTWEEVEPQSYIYC